MEETGRFWSRLSSPEKIAIGVITAGIIFYLLFRHSQNNSGLLVQTPQPVSSGPPDTSGGGGGGSPSFDPSQFATTFVQAIQAQQQADAAQFNAQSAQTSSILQAIMQQNTTLSNALQADLQSKAAANEGTNTPAANASQVQQTPSVQSPIIVNVNLPSTNAVPATAPSTNVGKNQPVVIPNNQKPITSVANRAPAGGFGGGGGTNRNRPQ